MSYLAMFSDVKPFHQKSHTNLCITVPHSHLLVHQNRSEYVQTILEVEVREAWLT